MGLAGLMDIIVLISCGPFYDLNIVGCEHRTESIFSLAYVIKSAKGPSIKDVGIFLAVFDTPLPHVGILTLIYLTSTF